MNQSRTPLTRRSVLRGVLTSTVAVPFGLTIVACDTSDVGGGGGGGGGDGDEVDLADKMVGAMEDFRVGTTFVASEPVSFSLLYRDHPNYPLKSDWSFLTHLSESNNVALEFTSVPLADYPERRNLLISAGDADSIISNLGATSLDRYVPSGTVLPVSKYVEHMPNYLAKVEAWGLQADLDRNRQADGEYYVLPGLYEVAKPEHSYAIRSDMFEAAGFTQDPQTFDEFRDQMLAVKEMFPELDYVWSERWNGNGPMEACLAAAGPSFGVRGGFYFGDGTIWDGSNYVFGGASEGYRQMLEYFAGLVEMGLFDPEGVTQDDDMADQKLTSGRCAVTSVHDQTIVTHRADLAGVGNTEAVLRQIVVPAGPAGNMTDIGRFQSGVGFSASALEQENFVAMLQFVDWLYYSDEGLEFAKWGVEGETFTRDADGTRMLVENIDMNGLNPGAPEHLQTEYGYCNGVFMPAHGSTADLVKSMMRDEVVEFVDGMNAKEFQDLGPGFLLDEMQREQATLLQTALTDLVKQATAGFIIGQRSLDDWDAYLAELEAAGMSRFLELVNGARRDA